MGSYSVLTPDKKTQNGFVTIRAVTMLRNGKRKNGLIALTDDAHSTCMRVT